MNPEPPRGITHPDGDVPGWDAAVKVEPPAQKLAALLARRGRWSASIVAHGQRAFKFTLSRKW